MRLLVAETTSTARAASADLARLGFLVTRAPDEETIRDFLIGAEQDALILDDRTDRPADRLVQAARQARPLMPVIIFAEGADDDRRGALIAAGADHIIHDVFAPAEIALRIQAMVRRAAGYAGPGIDTGEIHLDPMTRSAMVVGTPIRLARLEYEVLETLALRPGRYVDRDTLMTQLYAWGDEPDAAIIEVYLSRIRRKIADADGDPAMIETAPGRGWRLRTIDQALAA